MNGVRIHGRTAIGQQILSSITASTGISACIVSPVSFNTGVAVVGSTGATAIEISAQAGFGTAIEGMYDGWMAKCLGGTGVGRTVVITSYVGSTRIATVPNIGVTWDATSSFRFVPPFVEGIEAQSALVRVETAAINFTLNGSVPTVAAGTNVGMQLDPGEWIFLDDIQNVKSFRCINRVNASGSVVKIITFA